MKAKINKIFQDTSGHRVTRDSNLELFRCITMFLIVAHHYVVNSGLGSADSPIWLNQLSWRTLFLLIFGAWGKTSINCFILITGYYMCESCITGRKYFKLLAEIYFYKISIAAIFAFTLYSPMTLKKVVALILPFMELNRNFTGCFIVFYLFIPFLSILVKNLMVRQHVWLTLLCLFIYTVVEPMPGLKVPMHYVSWFMVLFLVASFMRLHMKMYMNHGNTILEAWLLILLLLVDVLTVLLMAKLSGKGAFFSRAAWFFLTDSNKLLPLLTSIMAFLFFKKMKLRYIPIINILGGATFGIFLIHANSIIMRKWLWRDILHCLDIYSSPWLAVHAIGSVLAIFVVCTVIDRLRIRFIEPPIMACFDRIWPSIVKCFNNIENWFTMKTRNFIGG